MSNKAIDGQRLLDMLRGGVGLLSAHAEEVNDLNVFPVPDGDTGTNMTMTLMGGLNALGQTDGNVAQVIGKFARGALMGARGNSGVILSQMLSGISLGLAECDTATPSDLAAAFGVGVTKAYGAVQKPTEGTILTVFRESVEYVTAKITEDFTAEDFFSGLIEQATRALAKTREMLPVLTEAGVVDSGGAGYLYMITGMYNALTGASDDAKILLPTQQTPALDTDSFTRDSALEFGYCTELMLRLTTAKCDPDAFSVDTLVSRLENMGGESIVAYKDGDMVKVHVHTFTPGEALNIAQEYGEFLTVKIENMSVGHSDTQPRRDSQPNKPYAVVAVATGDGLSALFTEMGADRIVSGGQTCNPSTEELIRAFDECHADCILVLPNNKNVILAAEQAASLYTRATVRVIPTVSIMEGYSALSVINPGISDIDTLVDNACRAARGVTGIEITRAVRDASVKGVKVDCGDYMAISRGAITATAGDAAEALMEALGELDPDDYELITLFVGEAVSDDEREALAELIEDKYPDWELTVYMGGQEVYDYLIALE